MAPVAHPRHVERLIYSASNYWLVGAGDVVSAVAFLVLGVRLFTGSIVGAAVCVIVGFLAWGGVEYAVHRWLLHGPPSIVKRAHAQHHADPTALIGTPAFVSTVLAGALWAFLTIFTTAGHAALAVFGFYAGYNYYALIHHLLHRHTTKLARLPRLGSLERAHRTHHARTVVNFGVSTTWWDRLFGSYQAPGDSTAR